MPFTFAHPGFALPMKKWKPDWFSATGLIFGSIAPDMDILLRLTHPRFHLFQYNPACIVFIIFPIALLFGLYFHLVLRNVLIDYLPDGLAEQLGASKNFNFVRYLKKHFPAVVLSIFFAIGLHLFLDFISHIEANTFRIYGEETFHSFTIGRAFYFTALYLPALLFTLLGFYLLLRVTGLTLSGLFSYTRALLTEKEKIYFYLTTGLLALVIAGIKTLISGIDPSLIADNLIINLTSGCMLSFTLIPTLIFIRNKIKKVS